MIHPCHTAERGDRKVATVLEKDRRVGAGTAIDAVVATLLVASRMLFLACMYASGTSRRLV